MTLRLLGLFAFLAAMTPPRDGAVPVEEEPNHRTVLENEYVQAFRVTLGPGQQSLMHVHARDDGAVRLSASTIAEDGPGRPLGPAESAEPGFVSARNNEAKPLTHRVHNVGTTVFDVIDVQILERPPGPAAPAISTPEAENAKMRVYRYELGPGKTTEPHTHARPYLLVAATPVDLGMTSPGGASMEHPVKAGDLHWVDAAVTHSFTNGGAEKGILVEFELK